MPKVYAGGDVDEAADAAIVEALANGNPRRALALLMARYGDRIYRFAYAMTHDQGLSEDIRQQVFVEAYRDFGVFAQRSTVRTWVFGIARYRCLDALKARRRWFRRFKNGLTIEAETSDFDLQRESNRRLDRRRLAEVLEHCLLRLPPPAREAVVLRLQQELSYNEVAAIIGDEPGTLQRRVARALPLLRKCVEARWPEEE